MEEDAIVSALVITEREIFRPAIRITWRSHTQGYFFEDRCDTEERALVIAQNIAERMREKPTETLASLSIAPSLRPDGRAMVAKAARDT